MYKKFITGAVVGIMAVSLAACGNDNAQNQENTTAATATQEETTATQQETTTAQQTTTAAEATTAAADKKDIENMKTVLKEIKEDVRVGTAGSSMNAVKVAADMLNWGVETKLSDETVQAEVKNWYASLSQDDKDDFNEEFKSVYSVYKQLIGPNAENIIKSVDYDIKGYPWSTEPVPAIESINKALGNSAK